MQPIDQFVTGVKMGKLRVCNIFRIIALALLCPFLFMTNSPASAAVAGGLAGKLIVGYQGWFGCPGDFTGNKQWEHWFFQNTPDVGHMRVDLLPSLSLIDQRELCKTTLTTVDGSPVFLYSAQNERVVATHFKWMADQAIDGVALERFVGLLSDMNKKKRNNHVLKNVQAGAEASGRVFFISYDVSGADPHTVMEDIRADWRNLANVLKITSSRSYLHSNGKPVLQIWGFGFRDRPGEPEEVANLITDLKEGRHELEAVTLVGGVPAFWRELREDSKDDSRWAAVYRSYDVISPWSVGRFRNEAELKAFVQTRVIPDLNETKLLKIGYMPVIFPGFSWFNLQTGRGDNQRAVLNEIPRQCGTFLWSQVREFLKAGVNMLFAAMFDELDEGTALMPTVSCVNQLPVGAAMVTLNQEGCKLPEDWYLQITGQAAGYLHNRQIPPVSLGEVLRVPSAP